MGHIQTRDRKSNDWGREVLGKEDYTQIKALWAVDIRENWERED